MPIIISYYINFLILVFKQFSRILENSTNLNLGYASISGFEKI